MAIQELTVNDTAASVLLTPGSRYVWRVGVDAGDGVTFTDWSDQIAADPEGVTTLNGIAGDITLSPGSGVAISTNGSTLTIDSTVPGVDLTGYATVTYVDEQIEGVTASVPSSYVSTLNGLPGAVTIGAGSGVTVTQAGSTLLISAAGAVSSINAESGAITLVGGDNIGIATQDGTITITGQPSGVTWSTAPLTPADPGSEGDIAYNDDYFFVRTSQGWRRTALSDWNAEIVISSQPQNLSLQPGGSGNFTVTAAASDGSTVGYQWQNSDDNGVTWDTITGSTAATYGVSGVSLADNGTLFRVVLSAANITSVTSDVATLTVSDTFRLLSEGSDNLLTESGDFILHDGAAGGVTLSLSGPTNQTAGLLSDWSQLGSDIDGEAASDYSGYSVALSSDGSRVAIGAPYNDGNGVNSGHVRIYDWSGSAWVQVGADIDGEAVDDYSGWSVALSSDGSRVAIGAPYNDGNGVNSGHVRIYDWSGSAWVQLGADIDGEAVSDYSGYSVALSSDGSRVAIGARYNAGNGTDAGHVRIYDWSGSAWVQVGADIDGEAVSDLSGHSVTLSSDGSRVAIGAFFNDGNGTDAGHVRIYDWSGSAWVQVGADIDGEAVSDYSGYSVALSSDGSRVAIGGYGNDGNGTDAGHVRIYDWSGTAWVQVGADIDGEAVSDYSGHSVALSSDGSRVAIGAIHNRGNGADAGHVRIYDWSGSAWVQVGLDIDSEAAGDFSGYSVALSSDGSRVAIGAIYNDGNGTYAGHVRVFDLASTPSATFSVSATASDGSTLTYQWQKSDDGVTFANVSGATSATLSLTGLTAADDNGDQYRVIVDSPSVAPVTSDAATLTVT